MTVDIDCSVMYYYNCRYRL